MLCSFCMYVAADEQWPYSLTLEGTHDRMSLLLWTYLSGLVPMP